MGKTVAYIAAAIVFVGIGALIAGLSVWYHHPNIQKQQEISETRTAQCDLISTGVGGSVAGTLYLEQIRMVSPVVISGNITGLGEGEHGFHIHQWGDLGNNCKNSGGHYNPFGFNHSAPNATERHVGDLGNVLAKSDAKTGTTITNVAITDAVLKMWGQYSIVGRAIVIHEGPDDLGKGNDAASLRTGNAGGRVACCNIYLAKKPTN